MTKLREVYQAIVAQSNNGVCILSQAELMKVVGLHSRRHLLRITKELQALGLIVIDRYYDRHKAQTKNRYLVRPMGQIESHQSVTDGTNGVPSGQDAITDGTNGVPSPGAMGLQESHKPLMNHDMNDKNQILLQLDFINAKNRKLCAALVDLPTARRWRELWEYCENNDAWGEYGIATNGVGYIVRLIKNGDPVPGKIQSSLPAASLDIREIFRSRGLTQGEIAAPIENATLHSDGFWR